MRFIDLIVKNPFRNKTRAILSIIGIGIGIATIVALGLITGGLNDSMQEVMNQGGAEITVSPYSENTYEVNSLLNYSYVDKLKNISGVNDVAGVLSWSESENSNMGGGPSGMDSMTLNGIEKDKLSLAGIQNINGSVYNDNATEVIIGKTTALEENKTINDTIEIKNTTFTITGIYETGSSFTDSGAYTSLSTLQNMTNQTGLSEILVKTNEGANDTVIADNIENQYPNNLTTLTTQDQAQMLSEMTSMLDVVSLAISALAIIVGTIGIINTMIMSVYERTKEIGVLKSVGWTNNRILLMIVGETIVLTLVAALVGIVFGIAVCEIGIGLIGNDTSFALSYNFITFARAIGISLIVGIIGGVYPAYKASKLAPTEALRYE